MESESLGVMKSEIISLQVDSSRWKRSAKFTKAVAEILGKKYVGIGIHMESMASEWCLKEVEELKHFSSSPRCHLTSQRDEVNECGVVFVGLK